MTNGADNSFNAKLQSDFTAGRMPGGAE